MPMKRWEGWMGDQVGGEWREWERETESLRQKDRQTDRQREGGKEEDRGGKEEKRGRKVCIGWNWCTCAYACVQLRNDSGIQENDRIDGRGVTDMERTEIRQIINNGGGRERERGWSWNDLNKIELDWKIKTKTKNKKKRKNKEGH